MNLEKFRAAEFERRTARVDVPALSEFFNDGQKAAWEVQGLTGPEYFKAEARIRQNSAKAEILKAFASENIKTKVQAFMQSIGISDDADESLVKMVAYVEMGVASVNLEQPDVVRLAEYHVLTMLKVFGVIYDLTCQGHVTSGESNATGTTPESATH
jgi:hypothetical protein